MAGGAAPPSSGAASDRHAPVTFPVILTCLVAASGGLIFGYDIGVSGGVSQMRSFLRDFFPDVLRSSASADADAYCLFDDQSLTAFTSSLYIAGLFASLAAGHVARSLGRRCIMLMGGVAFFVGAAVNAAAVNIYMLIIGRMFLGVGLGFTGQATPLYLAEISPPQWRGAFSSAFAFIFKFGIFTADLVNYGSSFINRGGWRLSVGMAAGPASIITVGSLLIPDSPWSLVLRDKPDLARASLQRVRGANTDIDPEFKEIVRAVDEAQKNEAGAFRRIIRREYRPYLVMATALPLFYQLTGLIILSLFGPLLFRTAGFGSNVALMAAVLLGVAGMAGVAVASMVIDRIGRKALFSIGGVLIFSCQVGMAWLLGAHLGSGQGATMPRNYGDGVIVLACLYTFFFSISWGALFWVVPNEIFPMEVRAAGQAVVMAVDLGLTFVLSQAFLIMLCRLKFAIFLFYGGFVVIMTVFMAIFLPETKGVPLESMDAVWATHWYWGRYLKERGTGDELK